MLILFDIDGTLLLSRHAGLMAMRDAAREIWGVDVSFDGVETAGRLDPIIWDEVARRVGREDQRGQHEVLRRVYAERLADRLDQNPTAYALPGVPELLDALAPIDGVTLGLLTGNYPETGRLKIRSAGIDPDLFAVSAWGDDADTRRGLPPVAMSRYASRFGGEIAAERVIVIGDTPHDVDSARHHGCRSLGVATGRFGENALRDAGADLVVADLSDTRTLLAWMIPQGTLGHARVSS